MALWRHFDKNSAAINNRYLVFVQTRGVISLFSDNHVNNYLKEILVYVYLGSTVNNWPTKCDTEAKPLCIFKHKFSKLILKVNFI